MTRWSVALEDLAVEVSGDLSVTIFRLFGRDTRGPGGAPIPFGQYGAHVRRRDPALGWRIVHEHLTAYDATKAR